MEPYTFAAARSVRWARPVPGWGRGFTGTTVLPVVPSWWPWAKESQISLGGNAVRNYFLFI